MSELQSTKQYRPGSNYCPWIRFQQKAAEKLVDNWAPGGRYHGGAHFPLMVFTKNSSWRSRDAEKRRQALSKAKKCKGTEGKGSREKHAGSGAHSRSSAAVTMGGLLGNWPPQSSAVAARGNSVKVQNWDQAPYHHVRDHTDYRYR